MKCIIKYQFSVKYQYIYSHIHDQMAERQKEKCVSHEEDSKVSGGCLHIGQNGRKMKHLGVT